MSEDEIPGRTGAMVLRMLYQSGPTETVELAIKSRTHPDVMAEAIALLEAGGFIWPHVGQWELTGKGLRAGSDHRLDAAGDCTARSVPGVEAPSLVA